MIVLRVELHSAVTKEVTTLHTVVIDNVGVHDGGRKADYRCRTWKRGEELLDVKYGKPHLREGVVEKHPRLSKPVLNLVYKALVAMGYSK